MALISHVLFPIMCFDEQDKELWEDDPHEFVRKTFDIMEDYTSQRVAACNLIIDLCKKRTQTTLVPTLEMCVGVCILQKKKKLSPWWPQLGNVLGH
jgi:importin-7